ncbi:MAG: collagen-like protein, partial [Porphyromonas sp.]|nr:collagen-like protein [Porphyromonas sp.]
MQSTLLLMMVAWLLSCTQVDIFAPIGPKGEKGDKGDKGQSTYELWKEKVANGDIDWDKNEVSENDFFRYLKGKDGKDGQNGKSAYQEWTEYIASGEVEDPHNPGQKWDPKRNTVRDFWAFLAGRPGADGKTPYIKDGYWWIGEENLNIPAVGQDGKTPVIEIGDNGNWIIDGKDTGKSSRGEKGEKG